MPFLIINYCSTEDAFLTHTEEIYKELSHKQKVSYYYTNLITITSGLTSNYITGLTSIYLTK